MTFVKSERNWISTEDLFIAYFFVNFGNGSWRQAEAWIVLLAGAVEVNALAQGAARQFTLAVDRTPNLPIERRTLHHWAIFRSFIRLSVNTGVGT